MINKNFLPRFEKTKFDIFVSILIHFAKNLLGLNICSGDIESLLITSPNTSSTLILVITLKSFLLSI